MSSTKPRKRPLNQSRFFCNTWSLFIAPVAICATSCSIMLRMDGRTSSSSMRLKPSIRQAPRGVGTMYRPICRGCCCLALGLNWRMGCPSSSHTTTYLRATTFSTCVDMLASVPTPCLSIRLMSSCSCRNDGGRVVSLCTSTWLMSSLSPSFRLGPSTSGTSGRLKTSLRTQFMAPAKPSESRTTSDMRKRTPVSVSSSYEYSVYSRSLLSDPRKWRTTKSYTRHSSPESCWRVAALMGYIGSWSPTSFPPFGTCRLLLMR
mmetsp:Transcript_28975/g.81608  ORF Transcript_28975/g.81608 Transcript_28975/m.81608 type:complete len:261 (+) Transcript_28975:514-1296(+)